MHTMLSCSLLLPSHTFFVSFRYKRLFGQNLSRLIFIHFCLKPDILVQCLRRLFEEKNAEQGYNGLKYFLTIMAVCLRTAYSVVDEEHKFVWRMLAGVVSAIAAIFCTYWDLVLDWGLLNMTSKNRWLRDKLLIPQKKVYFIAMVSN